MRETQFEEVVYLLANGQVTAELPFATFEEHVDRQLPMVGAPPGASLGRAAFAVIGPDLHIKGLVFFLLQFDELGRPDKNFNVPLPYLARNAGVGPDLGYGPVPVACRGSCTVPWQANNLWDPSLAGSANPMDALVQAVQNNKLELDPQPFVERRADRAPASVSTDKLVAEQVAALTTAHDLKVKELENHYEQKLVSQREVLEAKIELYKLENQRLLAQLDGSGPAAGNLRDAAG